MDWYVPAELARPIYTAEKPAEMRGQTDKKDGNGFQ
jgi:hypothetical protein